MPLKEKRKRKSIGKISFEYIQHLDLIDYPELIEQVWHCRDLVQVYNFHNLTSLVVSHCNNLVHVIPSHLLLCFENLEELVVSYCSAVNVIFNINDARVTQTLGKFRLKKLSLTDLPILENVWNKDPKGILSLRVLQEMRVASCDTLKYVFHASVAKDLPKLEVLSVQYCKGLVEIFSKDEMAAEGAVKKFKFPFLTSLYLRDLPGLKHLYPGLHKLEWPSLNELNVYHCNLMTIFKFQEDHPEDQALIPIEKIPSMEILSFDIGDTRIKWNRESLIFHFENLERFQQESDSVLYGLLGKLPTIEKLELYGGLLEEMFFAEKPNADYTGPIAPKRNRVI